jgi:hypothetical protein
MENTGVKYGHKGAGSQIMTSLRTLQHIGCGSSVGKEGRWK